MTRRKTPRFPFSTIAQTILPKWDISLAFVGPKKARELNEQLRGKSYIPNVLSYVAGEKSGEICICLHEAEKQAPSHEMDPDTFVLFLFIHGLLHLKGLPHGSTMEKCEQKFLTQFSSRQSRSYDTTHRNRN